MYNLLKSVIMIKDTYKTQDTILYIYVPTYFFIHIIVITVEKNIESLFRVFQWLKNNLFKRFFSYKVLAKFTYCIVSEYIICTLHILYLEKNQHSINTFHISI